MAIMAMDMAKKNKLIAACTALFFTQNTFAGDWLFSPAIIVDETYTDNVELNLTDELSSLVSQTGVALKTEYKSQLLEFNLASESVYAMYSHDHDLDDDFHTLNSDFRLKLGEQGFSLFGSATIDNRSRNSARNALADIVSADIVQVEHYSGGLAFNITNSDFKISSQIAYNITESADDIGNQDGYLASFASKNGRAARLLFWDTQANYQERKNDNDQTSRAYQGEVKLGFITSWKLNPFLRYYDEDNSGNVNSGSSKESNSYGLGVRWLITPRLMLDLSYNKPIGNKLDIDGKEQDEYLDTSIQWQPTVRTQLEANYSQRFFGDSYGLNFSHQNKRLTNTISYQENVQSFTRNNYNPIALGSFWCPDGNSDNLANCYTQNNSDINFDHYQLITLTDYELIEDDVLSLNKTLSWQSDLTLARSSFSLNINASNRDNLETRIKDNRAAINFTASRKVSGRSNINLKASYTDDLLQKDTDSERHDRYRQLSIGYSKSLNSALTFDFDLAHINRSSTEQQFNYQEGRVTFKITKDF